MSLRQHAIGFFVHCPHSTVVLVGLLSWTHTLAAIVAWRVEKKERGGQSKRLIVRVNGSRPWGIMMAVSERGEGYFFCPGVLFLCFAKNALIPAQPRPCMTI